MSFHRFLSRLQAQLCPCHIVYVGKTVLVWTISSLHNVNFVPHRQFADLSDARAIIYQQDPRRRVRENAQADPVERTFVERAWTEKVLAANMTRWKCTFLLGLEMVRRPISCPTSQGTDLHITMVEGGLRTEVTYPADQIHRPIRLRGKQGLNREATCTHVYAVRVWLPAVYGAANAPNTALRHLQLTSHHTHF